MDRAYSPAAEEQLILLPIFRRAAAAFRGISVRCSAVVLLAWVTLMEIFCAGDEVVRFEPVGPQDVAAAEQETDYVNHVFMQVNPGFLILYSFIKDALLSKVGVFFRATSLIS